MIRLLPAISSAVLLLLLACSNILHDRHIHDIYLVSFACLLLLHIFVNFQLMLLLHGLLLALEQTIHVDFDVSSRLAESGSELVVLWVLLELLLNT